MPPLPAPGQWPHQTPNISLFQSPARFRMDDKCGHKELASGCPGTGLAPYFILHASCFILYMLYTKCFMTMLSALPYNTLRFMKLRQCTRARVTEGQGSQSEGPDRVSNLCTHTTHTELHALYFTHYTIHTTHTTLGVFEIKNIASIDILINILS